MVVSAVLSPETPRLLLTQLADEIRLDARVLPVSINEGPSHAALMGRLHCAISLPYLPEHAHTILSSTITQQNSLETLTQLHIARYMNWMPTLAVTPTLDKRNIGIQTWYKRARM